MRRSTIAYIAAAVAVPAAIAGVGPYAGMLRGSLGAEAEFAVDGDMFRSAIYDASALAGQPATLELRGQSAADTHDAGVGGKAELAYGINDNVEIFGAVGYSKSSASGFEAGAVTLTDTDTVLPVFGTFSDFDTWSIEAGARYYTGTPTSTFRPYIGGSVGVAFADSIDVDLQVNGASVAGIDNFFNSSTMFTAGAEAGVAFGDGERIQGSLSVGVKYVSGFDTNREALDAQGVGSLATSSDRIVVPVKGTIGIKF